MAMSVLMAAGMLAGCGSNGSTSSSTASGSASSASGEVSTDGVTISIFDKNSGSNTFDDPVAKAIEEKTGVKIQVENPTGDPLEKLNLMLTGQNYPDIVLMDRGNDIVNRYIEAGALLPLNDLIDEYGPDVKEMYGETLNKSRYTDGKNYYLNNWYGEDPDPVAGVLMRYDYLCEIVGKDRADSDEPFTQEEYIDICKKFKELHPTIDGKESIAITFDAESKNYDGTLKGMYGLKTYYQDGDNLEHVAKAPNFKEMMSFANELYTEGLLDKEWVVNKKNQWTQKLSAGNVFSTFASYWDTDAANTALASSVGEDAKFYSYKILGNGISTDEITSKDVYDAAMKNDKIALEIFEATGSMLGEAFADFVAFSSPEAIILFGGLTKAGDLIMNPIKRSMEKNMLKVYAGKTKLLFSQLKESDAAVLGASALGWEVRDQSAGLEV